MALRDIDAFCDACGTEFRARPHRSFIGFQLLSCPQCDAELRYPLTTGYRIVYGIMSTGMIASFGLNLLIGRVTFPGFVGFAVLVGLFKDWRLRKELASGASARHLPPIHAPPGADEDAAPERQAT